jgi:hypothetical protein
MKKANNIPEDYDDGMLPEYDFSGKKGVRGKYYRAMSDGYSVRIHNEDGTVTEQRFGPLENTVKLDRDAIVYFPDSKSVNKALRTLISIIPDKKVGEKQAKYKVNKKPIKKSAKKIAASK